MSDSTLNRVARADPQRDTGEVEADGTLLASILSSSAAGGHRTAKVHGRLAVPLLAALAFAALASSAVAGRPLLNLLERTFTSNASAPVAPIPAAPSPADTPNTHAGSSFRPTVCTRAGGRPRCARANSAGIVVTRARTQEELRLTGYAAGFVTRLQVKRAHAIHEIPLAESTFAYTFRERVPASARLIATWADGSRHAVTLKFRRQ